MVTGVLAWATVLGMLYPVLSKCQWMNEEDAMLEENSGAE